MFHLLFLPAALGLYAFAAPQNADDVVNQNIAARGGIEKIRAIKTLRMTGRVVFPGGFAAATSQENMRPNMVRETFALQGMTAVQAYDGAAGWAIQPFSGKKDPQRISDDDMRDLLIDSDLEGPLVDYKAKGNAVEYLGHDVVDGDDALRLKVTLKNGDIIYDYLDPDTFLEIRREVREFIRGQVRETVTDVTAYKPVGGVMFPFSLASGAKNRPSEWQRTTIDKIEVNVPLQGSEFALPSSLK